VQISSAFSNLLKYFALQCEKPDHLVRYLAGSFASRCLGTIVRSRRRSSALPWRTQMIGEDIDDGPNKVDQAKEAVQAATQTVKETTQSVADAIEAGRHRDPPLDRLARWAQEAPLRAVAVAFLVGVLLGRRRR
jgi:ElaB/YqjD/DUF883 family membrane-anchored ribosome-binding protein